MATCPLFRVTRSIIIPSRKMIFSGYVRFVRKDCKGRLKMIGESQLYEHSIIMNYDRVRL